MFDGIKNLGSILKQAQQIGGQMGQMTEEMRKRRVTGTAGGSLTYGYTRLTAAAPAAFTRTLRHRPCRDER